MASERFIIAGGGTGGHIFPAIAIANAIRELCPAAKVLFVGAKGKMEMDKIPKAGFRIEGLTIAGFNRSSLIKNITLPVKLIRSFWQVSGIISRFQPDAVIGVGGYSTYPVLRMAQAKGIPTFIHEANSFAGKSNVMLARQADIIFTGSDGMEKYFPAQKLLVSGNPVRKEIVNNRMSRAEALEEWGLSSSKTTVLVIGGSLGAKSINEAVGASLNDLLKHDMQLIWQTGESGIEMASKLAEGKQDVKVSAFFNRMDLAYAAADMVISRSGAMSIAELCMVKKPVIFVPYPLAAEDHQTANAMNLVQKEAAWMIKDEDVRDQLLPLILKLNKDESMKSKMRENIGKLAVANADGIIAQTILKYLRERTGK